MSQSSKIHSNPVNQKNHSSDKLTPKLRFKEFDGEWKRKHLGSECNHISYGLTVRPDFVEVGIPLISAREITSGEVNIEKGPKISLQEFDKLSDKAKPRKGDVFLTKTGTIGLSARFLLDIPIAITQNIAVIRLNDITRNSAEFLIQYFKTQNFYRSAISRVNQSTIMDLQLGDIRKILIPFAELPEQQKIAAFLSAVDAKIQQLSKKKALLEQYKKGVMQQLFSQKLRFKQSNGEAYPDWEEKRLGEYLIHKSTKNKDLLVPLVLSVSNKKGFISQNEQFDGYEVASKDLSNYKIVNRDDIAYNPSRINVGSIARLINFEKGIVSPMYIVFSLKDELDKIFFENLYNIHRFKHLIKVGCSGSVRDSLNFDDLCDFEFKFPSIEEQQKIATYLSSIDSKIERVAQQIEKTQEFKKGLLQQMFV